MDVGSSRNGNATRCTRREEEEKEEGEDEEEVGHKTPLWKCSLSSGRRGAQARANRIGGVHPQGSWVSKEGYTVLSLVSQ